MYQIASYNVLNHCIFKDVTVAAQFLGLTDKTNYLQQFLSDIYQARNWILGFGFGCSFILGFVYCLLLRVPGVVTLLTWGSICGVIALFAAVGYGLWKLSDEWKAQTDNSHSNYEVRDWRKRHCCDSKCEHRFALAHGTSHLPNALRACFTLLSTPHHRSKQRRCLVSSAMFWLASCCAWRYSCESASALLMAL